MTLTPTKSTGATAMPNPMLYVDPEAETTDEAVAGRLAETGLNPVFLGNFLSGMLAHERCGTHLYRSVAGRTQNPILKQKYEQFGEETLRHVEILEQMISDGGGNPNFVSATARCIEGMDSRLLETTFMLDGSLDPMTVELAMLDAVLLAETIDHANWHNLALLVEKMQEGELRDRFQAAVNEVEDEEDEHLDWARTTTSRLLQLQAESSVAATIGVKTEELVARVRDWLRA